LTCAVNKYKDVWVFADDLKDISLEGKGCANALDTVTFYLLRTLFLLYRDKQQTEEKDNRHKKYAHQVYSKT
jgi:hypothetical protein